MTPQTTTAPVPVPTPPSVATPPVQPAGAASERDALAEDFGRDGFVLLPDLLDADALARVRAEALAVCRGERGDVAGVEPARPGEDEEAVLRRYLCVHFPHKISPVLQDVATAAGAVDALTAVIGPDVKLVQTMLFIKSEGKPGQAWHQDETFIPTRDRSLRAVWIALDDATVENGCLWVVPGSHRAGVLHPDREQDDPAFDCTREAYGFSADAAVPVEVPAGTAVLFDGYLLHRSLPNTGRHGMRRAFVSHYMSARSLLPWHPPAPGELMGVTDLRDVLLVAGDDPYAWKGTVDVNRPHVRPDREGGCRPA